MLAGSQDGPRDHYSLHFSVALSRLYFWCRKSASSTS